jgi:hypothetical protein
LAENAENKNEKSLDLWIPPVSILLLTKNLLKINKFSAKWFLRKLMIIKSGERKTVLGYNFLQLCRIYFCMGLKKNAKQ